MKLAPFICFSIYVRVVDIPKLCETCSYSAICIYICGWPCISAICIYVFYIPCYVPRLCVWVYTCLFAKLKHIASHIARLGMWARFCFMDTPKNFDTLCCPGYREHSSWTNTWTAATVKRKRRRFRCSLAAKWTRKRMRLISIHYDKSSNCLSWSAATINTSRTSYCARNIRVNQQNKRKYWYN